MKRGREFTSFVLVLFVALSWLPLSAVPSWAFSLPPRNDYDVYSAKNGNFLVYALPLLGLHVGSTSGIIKDGVAVYAGSSGSGVKKNFPGMDADKQSWDATPSAFLAVLRGGTPLFFFNQNGSDSGLVGTPATMNVPANDGLNKGWVCLDGTGGQTACDGSGNPVVIGPIHHNAGKKILHDLDKKGGAYAILFPALSPALAACPTNGIGGARCPWESVSTRLDLDAISDGGDPFFIVTQEQVTVTPEPVAMVLGGTGLILLGYAARKRLFGS